MSNAKISQTETSQAKISNTKISNAELTRNVIKNLRDLADALEILIISVNEHNESSEETLPAIDNSLVVEETIQATDNSVSVEDTSTASEQAENQPTLEEVRALLAEKNRDGHREKIKDILTKYGATKLTSLDPVHYNKVMQEAGEIK